MAKRVPEGEKPYNPVEASLVRAVILGAEAAEEQEAVEERDEAARSEEPPRIPQALQPTPEHTPSKVVTLPRLAISFEPVSLCFGILRTKSSNGPGRLRL